MFISLLLLVAGNILCQNENSDLQSKYEQKRQYKLNVYQRTLKYIQANPDNPKLADLYFNLAELSAEIDVFEPWKTASYYQKVLEYDPHYLFKDVVYYNIGYYSYKAIISHRDNSRLQNIELAINWPDSLRLSPDKLEPVISAYKKVFLEMPDSPYNTDAVYRLGRVYFDLAIDARIAKPYFEEAINYFDIVAKREGDPLRDYGLFQRAWTYFASGQFTKAIEDFSSILQILQNTSESEKRTFFEADAIENIAYSLIEYDGTDFVGFSQAAEVAARVLRSLVTDEYGEQILLKAVQLKRKYNAPMQAVDLYQSYLLLYPDSKISPAIIDSIIVIYQQNPRRVRGDQKAEELIINEMNRLVTDFTTESAWYQKNKGKDIWNELAVIQEAYAFLEPKYFNNFLRTRSQEDYEKYEQLVINYTAFPEFSDPESIARKKRMRKNIVDLSQDLAEITENPAHYFDTIAEINSYLERQSTPASLYHYHELKFYNYEKLYDLLIPVVKNQPFVDEERNLNLDKHGLDSLMIMAASEYLDFLEHYEAGGPDVDVQLIKVLYFRAELFYENNLFDEAKTDFLALLQHSLDRELKMISYSRLAEISQFQKRYDDAEFYFREASKYAENENKEFENNILAAQVSKAEALEASSNYHQAAGAYLKIAAELESEDQDAAIAFKLKAIDNFKLGGEFKRAIDIYLEIAAGRNTRGEILSAYHGAWSIADSLQYWQQSLDIRRQFISLYPRSNEAFKLRLQIVGLYESEKLNDKREAARLLEALHSDASKIDLGGENPANILLHAIKLYKELNDDEKVISLSKQFDQLYPEHEKANELLIAAAKILKEKGDLDNYEKIAERLYQKDPNIDLIVEVAVEKLKNIKETTDNLFEAGKYDAVIEMIGKFYEEESKFFQEGLEFPTAHIHETFDYYQNYINFIVKYENALRRAQQDILEKSPDELIKVNKLTRWKDHLAEGENRISRLMKKCDTLRDDFISLIQEGNKFNLETEQRTKALYYTAKAYDYSADVVLTQVQKYLDISNQLNNQQMKANPIQQQQYKTALKNTSLQLATEFRKKAAQIYQTLLKTFYDDKDYSDRWVELSLERMIDLGIRKDASQPEEPLINREEAKDSIRVEKKTEIKKEERQTVVTDNTWQAAGSALRFNSVKTNIDLPEFCAKLVWLPVGKANFQYFKNQMYGLENSSAREIWFAELDTTNVDIIYFRKSFVLPEQFEDAKLKIFGQHMITVWVNGDLLIDAQGIIYDNKLKKVKVNDLSLSNLKAGENEIIIEVIGADYYKGLIAEISYKTKEGN